MQRLQTVKYQSLRVEIVSKSQTPQEAVLHITLSSAQVATTVGAIVNRVHEVIKEEHKETDIIVSSKCMCARV